MAGLLTVDRGNSTLDCLAHGSGERCRFDVAAIDATPLRAFLRRTAPESCIAVTVVSGGLDALRAELGSFAVGVQLAGSDLPCPLPLDYTTPATLGADRWLGALAAHRRFGRAIVVDCGSATTCNLVELDGTFRGGPIAPGLRAFVLGLAAVTPALPTPALDAVPAMPPRSSQHAVDAGVLIGYAGLVERLVADLLRAAAGPAHVVLTGGRAATLALHTRLRAEVVPDLVHQGLALLGANPDGPRGAEIVPR